MKLTACLRLSLLIACAWTVASVPVSAQAPITTGTNPNSPNYGVRDDLLVRDLHTAVNNYRVEIGLPKLSLDDKLSELATKFARELAASPTLNYNNDGFGPRFAEVMSEIPSVTKLGENTAHAFPDTQIAGKTVQYWTQEQRFNRNLVQRWATTGIGVAMARNGDVYIVQYYANAGGASTEVAGTHPYK